MAKEVDLNRQLMEGIRDTIKSYGVTTILSKHTVHFGIWPNMRSEKCLMISCRGLITQNMYIIFDLRETIIISKYHPDNNHYYEGKKLTFNITDPSYDINRVTEVIKDLKAV